MQNYDDYRNLIDVLDVNPEDEQKIRYAKVYRKMRMRSFFALCLVFAVISGIVALVVHNKSQAYEINRVMLREKSESCTRLLYLNISNNNNSMDLSECDNIISGLPEDQAWAQLYTLGSEVLTFVNKYQYEYNDNYDYTKSFSYFNEKIQGIHKTYSLPLEKLLKPLQKDYTLYQSLNSRLNNISNKISTGSISKDDAVFEITLLKRDYNDLMDSPKKEEFNNNLDILSDKVSQLTDDGLDNEE